MTRMRAIAARLAHPPKPGAIGGQSTSIWDVSCRLEHKAGGAYPEVLRMLLPQTHPAVGDATIPPDAVPDEQAGIDTPLNGLTETEVEARRAAGQSNAFRPGTGRS